MKNDIEVVDDIEIVDDIEVVGDVEVDGESVDSPSLDDFNFENKLGFGSSDGEVIKTFAAYTYSNVELKEVPEDLIKALIATEDKNFYRHPGWLPFHHDR